MKCRSYKPLRRSEELYRWYSWCGQVSSLWPLRKGSEADVLLNTSTINGICSGTGIGRARRWASLYQVPWGTWTPTTRAVLRCYGRTRNRDQDEAVRKTMMSSWLSSEWCKMFVERRMVMSLTLRSMARSTWTCYISPSVVASISMGML